MLLRSAFSPPTKLFPPSAGERGDGRSSAHKPQHRRLLLSAASSGYRKVALETEGAYRIIDDETGESVILWGEDPPHLPSKEALFGSNPSSSPVQRTAAAAANTASVAVGTFGKLKALKVKALLTRNNSNSRQRKSPQDDGGESAVDVDSDIIAASNPASVKDVDVGLRTVNPRLSSYSSFARRRQQEEYGEDRLLTRGVSPQIHSSTSSPSTKRGWGANTGYRQKKESSVDVGGGFFSRKSFKEMGCADYIIDALRSQLFLRPSHIQAMSYAPILEGKSCIIADQSGSGKTLAYLTPVVQCLRQDELLGIAKSESKNPRVVILVPTAELASQVLNNCRALAKHGVPFRSIIATGGFRQKTQLESLQQDLDVLIATPGRFVYLLKEGYLELNNLRSVVLDEVDILYSDDEFEEVLQNLISHARVSTQYLFVTATLPADIYNRLVEVFPDCQVVMGPRIHRTSSNLEEILVDCSGDGEEKNPDTAFLNKKSALLRIVEESPVDRTIVFCNKIETCRRVENTLNRYDRKGTKIQVLPFHSALEQELRLSNMKEFLKSKTSDPLFLVCTDRASRGIDFRAVDHVVLFDLPRDPSEYVRRVGRVARGAGGKGKAFVFAVGKQVSLARRIIERNLKGHPLHTVPC